MNGWHGKRSIRRIGAAKAQGEPNYKWEAGFQVTTIQFGAPAEKPFGLGGRIGRQLGNHITVEAEANHFPENPSGNFGETQAVGGIKAGGHLGSWGGFIKIRPGLLHFGGRDFRARNSALNYAVTHEAINNFFMIYLLVCNSSPVPTRCSVPTFVC